MREMEKNFGVCRVGRTNLMTHDKAEMFVVIEGGRKMHRSNRFCAISESFYKKDLLVVVISVYVVIVVP